MMAYVMYQMMICGLNRDIHSDIPERWFYGAKSDIAGVPVECLAAVFLNATICDVACRTLWQGLVIWIHVN